MMMDGSAARRPANRPPHVLVLEPDPRGHTQEWLDHLLLYLPRERIGRLSLAVAGGNDDRQIRQAFAQRRDPHAAGVNAVVEIAAEAARRATFGCAGFGVYRLANVGENATTSYNAIGWTPSGCNGPAFTGNSSFGTPEPKYKSLSVTLTKRANEGEQLHSRKNHEAYNHSRTSSGDVSPPTVCWMRAAARAMPSAARAMSATI